VSGIVSEDRLIGIAVANADETPIARQIKHLLGVSITTMQWRADAGCFSVINAYVNGHSCSHIILLTDLG
jgi:hypothetical protein